MENVGHIPSGLGRRRGGGSLYRNRRFFIIKLDNICTRRWGAENLCIIPGNLFPSIGIINFAVDMARIVW